jgi:hypothetical protein
LVSVISKSERPILVLVHKTEVFFKQQNEETRTLQIFIKRNPSGSKYKALRRPISRIMNKQDKKTKNK